MKQSVILQMINNSLEEFEYDYHNEKNLKMMLSFDSKDLKYDEREFKIKKPKFKKKLNRSNYVKFTGKNQLF